MKTTCCDNKATEKRSFWMMLAFVIIFTAPSVFAVLFYRHPTWLGHASTNRGQLLKPSEHLQFLGNRNHWRLVFWSPKACDTECMRHAERLARIRLALGRRLYQVDACLVLGVKEPVLNEIQAKILRDQDIRVLKLPPQGQADAAHLGSGAAFYIVSPDNALVLTYPVSVAEDDVFHDIKQLVSQA